MRKELHATDAEVLGSHLTSLDRELLRHAQGEPTRVHDQIDQELAKLRSTIRWGFRILALLVAVAHSGAAIYTSHAASVDRNETRKIAEYTAEDTARKYQASVDQMLLNYNLQLRKDMAADVESERKALDAERRQLAKMLAKFSTQDIIKAR
jgi:hypothetical protein